MPTIDRKWLLFAAICAVFMLIIFMPLRAGLAMVFPQNQSLVTGKQVHGTIWRGGIHDLKIGNIPVGNVQTQLRVAPVLIGRMDLTFEQIAQTAQMPLTGRLISGWGQREIRDANGNLDLSLSSGRIPLSRMEFQSLSARFSGDNCVEASGTVRLLLAPDLFAALNMNSGFLGTAQCKDGALFLPLVSQSAMERADLLLKANGSYHLTLTVMETDPVSAITLVTLGFAPVSGGYQIVMKGQL